MSKKSSNRSITMSKTMVGQLERVLESLSHSELMKLRSAISNITPAARAKTPTAAEPSIRRNRQGFIPVPSPEDDFTDAHTMRRWINLLIPNYALSIGGDPQGTWDWFYMYFHEQGGFDVYEAFNKSNAGGSKLNKLDIIQNRGQMRRLYRLVVDILTDPLGLTVNKPRRAPIAAGARGSKGAAGARTMVEAYSKMAHRAKSKAPKRDRYGHFVGSSR